MHQALLQEGANVQILGCKYKLIIKTENAMIQEKEMAVNALQKES